MRAMSFENPNQTRRKGVEWAPVAGDMGLAEVLLQSSKNSFVPRTMASE